MNAQGLVGWPPGNGERGTRQWLLPSMGRGWYGCRVTTIKKSSNSPVVMRWPPPTPMDPTHTIKGRGHVGGVLGKGRVSLVRRLCPHVSCGGTSADDSGRLIMMASFFDGLWCIFYLGDCMNRDSGFAVAHASDTPMQLRRQRNEAVVITLQIICHRGWFR
jgi:hypothetical protein